MLNNTTKMLANDFISQYPNPCRAQLLEIAQLLSVDMKELITNEKERNV